MDSPLWQAIPVVARGDIVVLNIQPAFGNWGVRGLELALADIAAQLTVIADNTTSSPVPA